MLGVPREGQAWASRELQMKAVGGGGDGWKRRQPVDGLHWVLSSDPWVLENALPCLQGRDLDPALENELILGTYDRAPLVLAHERWDRSQPGLGSLRDSTPHALQARPPWPPPQQGNAPAATPPKLGSLEPRPVVWCLQSVCMDAGMNVSGFELGLRTPWLSCGHVAASLTLLSLSLMQE